MAQARSWAFLIAVVLLLGSGTSVKAIVQFKFNTPELAISEGEDLSRELFILKVGQNEMDIAFQVRVNPGTALENTDYRANSGLSYVFTNSTSQLPIRTQLLEDRAGESIENFTICLPDAQVLQPMGAEAIEPVCVIIIIVDDDSVVIGFKNSFEAVVEGRNTTVCAEVKQEGLRLDPFDRVPLTVRTNPDVSSEVRLNTTSIVFEGAVGEQCVIIRVTDGDTTNIVNRSYNLTLESTREVSSVPVLIYPSTVSILVIDDDIQDTSFNIVSPQPVITVLEGGRIEGIQVQRLEDTVLTYNVTLMVTALTIGARSSDVMITNPLIFEPTTTRKNVMVEIVNDNVPEKQREFSISIDRIVAIVAPNADLAASTDSPVTIVVYDNDFEIGFTRDTFSVPEGSSSDNICVAIFKPETRNNIEPSLAIPITVILENSTSYNLTLDKRDILLNATNTEVCLSVQHTADNSDCDADASRSYPIQLAQTGAQDYTVRFRQQTADITIDDTQDCQGALSSGEIAATVIVPLIISAILIVIIVAVVVLIIKKRHHRKPKNEKIIVTYPGKNKEVIINNGSSSGESSSSSTNENKTKPSIQHSQGEAKANENFKPYTEGAELPSGDTQHDQEHSSGKSDNSELTGISKYPKKDDSHNANVKEEKEATEADVNKSPQDTNASESESDSGVHKDNGKGHKSRKPDHNAGTDNPM